MREYCNNCCESDSSTSNGILVFTALIAFVLGLVVGALSAAGCAKKHCEGCNEEEEFDSAEYVRSLHLDDNDED
ncbi:MAG: hypothetical protein J5999_10655 [Oscillospiraceae bacterium]|nr:hypothetical protein [Oscillospiraceae bacterium]